MLNFPLNLPQVIHLKGGYLHPPKPSHASQEVCAKRKPWEQFGGRVPSAAGPGLAGGLVAVVMVIVQVVGPWVLDGLERRMQPFVHHPGVQVALGALICGEQKRKNATENQAGFAFPTRWCKTGDIESPPVSIRQHTKWQALYPTTTQPPK